MTTGAVAGTVKAYLNGEPRGPKVRLVKIRMFRPFPRREVAQALRGTGRVVVLDRNLSPGGGGIFAGEVRAALQGGRPGGRVTSVIGGLGGVDITPEHIGELADAVIKGENRTRRGSGWRPDHGMSPDGNGIGQPRSLRLSGMR